MLLKLKNKQADIFVPDATGLEEALRRTTHLCIGAHSDDIEINCYPAVAECYEKPDRWFTGVTVTDGAGSSRTGKYADFTNAEMIALRREEQRKAASLGKYNVQFQLAYSSAAVRNDPDVVDDLRQILEIARPETIYLHNPADKHDTHVAVFLRSLEAIRSLPRDRRPARALAFEGWRDLDWLDDAEKIALDASKYPDLAEKLTSIFDSQISGGKRYDLAIEGRRRANATFFDPHQGDATDAITWAMDVTPLIHDDNLPVNDFVLGFIERFREDVAARLNRLSRR